MDVAEENSTAVLQARPAGRFAAARPKQARPTALVLCPEMPFPPNGGSALRSASLITYLARRYDVDLVVFAEASSQETPSEPVPPGLRRLEHVRFPARPATRSGRAVRAVWQMLRGSTPMMALFSGLGAPLEKLLAGRQYDVAVIEQTWLAPYLDEVSAVADRVLLNLHNVESEIYATAARQGPWPWRGVNFLFAAAWRRLEHRWLPRYDELLMTSGEDAVGVRRFSQRDDTARIFPNTIPWHPPAKVEVGEALIFSGTLIYGPNREALSWFHETIWPDLRARWPQLTWRIVGRQPEAVPAALRADERIDIVGAVPEAIPILAAAKIAIVPLLSGSGTRLKILEAWAAGVPVVSTSLGAEGHPVTDGVHLLIADTPAEFAAAIERLLRDSELCAALSRAGRAFYEEHYTWEAGWKKLEAIGL